MPAVTSSSDRPRLRVLPSTRDLDRLAARAAAHVAAIREAEARRRSRAPTVVRRLVAFGSAVVDDARPTLDPAGSRATAALLFLVREWVSGGRRARTVDDLSRALAEFRHDPAPEGRVEDMLLGAASALAWAALTVHLGQAGDLVCEALAYTALATSEETVARAMEARRLMFS